MIEGLKFEMTGTELQGHFNNRATHHRKRQEEYSKQATLFPEDDTEPSKVSNSSPRKSLEEKALEHKRKAEIAEWRSKHVMVNETYQLTENDLSQAEIVSARY